MGSAVSVFGNISHTSQHILVWQLDCVMGAKSGDELEIQSFWEIGTIKKVL